MALAILGRDGAPGPSYSAAAPGGMVMKNPLFFDPRTDRLARDIRNEMARVFVKCLAPEADLGPVNKWADRVLATQPGPIYENYIRDRRQRYLAAKATITGRAIGDNFYRALALWDQELFFETHEVLEALWHEASGTPRLILQALIRAAGFHIHLAVGNRAGAEKMAARAAEVLHEYRAEVPPFPGLARLLASLDRRDPAPPKLL
jgi:hypothetical protein